MNLYLRLFRILIVGLFRRRLSFLGESVLKFVVLPNDLDINIHMNNARYFAIMDLGRVDLMARSGLLKLVRRYRWAPLLGGSTIRFRRALGPFERYRLHTRLLGWDDKWLYIEHRIESAKGHVAAVAVVKGLFRGPDGNVPPDELARLANFAEPRPVLPEALVTSMAFDVAAVADA